MTTKLHPRPEPINGIELPTIRNLAETAHLNPHYGAILTAGPSPTECEWGHPNHRIWEFDDTTDNYYGPKLHQIEEMIFWGANQTDLLVHCHAGISRSTATAWGVSIARGADPEQALTALYNAHPNQYGRRRPFGPNELIVAHLETIFGDNTLSELRRTIMRRDPSLLPWI